MSVCSYPTRRGTLFLYKFSWKGVQYFKRGFSSRKEAEEAEKLQKIEAGIPVELTWHLLLGLFLGWYQKRVKRSTWVSFMYSVENHLKKIPDVPVEEVTLRMMEEVIQEDSSSKRSHRLLLAGRFRAVMDYARVYHGIENREAEKIFVPKDYSIRMPEEKFVLSANDFVRLDEVFRGDDMFRLLFRVAFVCGLRISETLGLQVCSYHEEKGALLINQQATDHLLTGKTEIISPKTEKSVRWCYLPPFLEEEILLWIKEDGLQEKSFLFHGKNKEYPVGANTVRRRLKEGIKKSGLPQFSFHAFRRSEASLLNDSGLSGEVISSYLGHDSLKTAKRYYLGASEEKKKRAAGLLEELVGNRLKP